MRKNVPLLIWIFWLFGYVLPVMADDDPCDEYKHIKLSIVIRNSSQTILFDASNNGTITPPHIDSVWITTREDQTNAVLTSHAQSGEPISTSSLEERQYYIIWIQIGECIQRLWFQIRKTHLDIEESTLLSHKSAIKILRNGALYIERGGKTFNALGAEVK